MIPKVDQVRARNRRRIQRMGGVVASNVGISDELAEMFGDPVDEPGVIRDAVGTIIRRP